MAQSEKSGQSISVFHTTYWSVVLQAASDDSATALERLCRAYCVKGGITAWSEEIYSKVPRY